MPEPVKPARLVGPLADEYGRRFRAAQDERIELGVPEPEPTPKWTSPNLIGAEWSSPETDWPTRFRQRMGARLPRQAGTATHFAELFPWWGDDARARLLDAAEREDRPIVLNGPAGTGKTSVACWLGLRDAVWSVWDLSGEKPEPRVGSYMQLYRRAWGLLGQMKRGFKTPGETIDSKCLRADWLCLDDLEEAETAWDRKTLADIIVRRVDGSRRTVLCLDQDPADFEQAWGGACYGALKRSGLIVNLSRSDRPEVAGKTHMEVW